MEQVTTVVACQVVEQQQNQRSDTRNVPEDIVLEILRRLPVKNLLRFTCVCKRWQSLISSYSFRKLHRQTHSSSTPLIITFHRSEGKSEPGMQFYLTTFDLYGKFVQQCTLPISSANLSIMSIPFQSKLLCFAESSEKRFFSYNPSTRHFFRLPDSPCFSSSDFKLLTSSYGYIPSKDEYMLVHMVDKKNSLEPYICEVLTYSISDNFQLHYNEWRSIMVTTKLNGLNSSSGVFFRGAFYWVVCDENDNRCSMSLDVETEVFSTVRFPQGVTSSTFLALENSELYIMEEAQLPGSLDIYKLSSDVNGNKEWDSRGGYGKRSFGYTFTDDPLVFDSKIMFYRIAYWRPDGPRLRLVKYGKLNCEDRVLEDDVNYDMTKWDVNIYTNNLFTF